MLSYELCVKVSSRVLIFFSLFPIRSSVFKNECWESLLMLNIWYKLVLIIYIQTNVIQPLCSLAFFKSVKSGNLHNSFFNRWEETAPVPLSMSMHISSFSSFHFFILVLLGYFLDPAMGFVLTVIPPNSKTFNS